jgi:hypothetical protein
LNNGQAVRQGQRLVLVVGDQDEGDPDRPLQLAELDVHALAELLV